ncbi:MAG: T9SS type A sorting domain-containing protein [Weeksellaceae bacterium]
MRKFYFLLAVIFSATTISAQNLAFDGADFEDFAAFEAGLNSYGLQDYATQGVGEGVDGSNSLSIVGTPTRNDYVFTATAPEGLPADITEIFFFVKGTSPSKSISMNLYDNAGDYYKFNGGEITNADVVLEAEGSNQYAGSIDTKGNWTKVSLNLENISNYSTDASANFFALKVGKESAFDIDVDNFYLVSKSMGTIELGLNKNTLKVAVAQDNLVFEGSDVKAVEVYNLNGQKVANSTYIGGLEKGVYIAVVEDNKGNKSSVKFVK